MYKLCVALAFLAVAAANPNWPLGYSSYPGLSSVYSPGYPAYGSYGSAVYPAPHAYSSYPVVAKTFPAPVTAPLAPAVASTYSFSGPSIAKPVVAPVPYSASFAPNYASSYAAIAPVGVGASPFVHPGYAGYAPFAWKK